MKRTYKFLTLAGLSAALCFVMAAPAMAQHGGGGGHMGGGGGGGHMGGGFSGGSHFSGGFSGGRSGFSSPRASYSTRSGTVYRGNTRSAYGNRGYAGRGYGSGAYGRSAYGRGSYGRGGYGHGGYGRYGWGMAVIFITRAFMAAYTTHTWASALIIYPLDITLLCGMTTSIIMITGFTINTTTTSIRLLSPRLALP
jgi:hypothetical protein